MATKDTSGLRPITHVVGALVLYGGAACLFAWSESFRGLLKSISSLDALLTVCSGLVWAGIGVAMLTPKDVGLLGEWAQIGSGLSWMAFTVFTFLFLADEGFRALVFMRSGTSNLLTALAIPLSSFGVAAVLWLAHGPD